MNPLYDVEADWVMMSTCNFRCTYCFWSVEDLGRKISPIGHPEILAKFFDNSNKIWLLHLTGGEPLLYPDFINLCQLLTQKHFISLNSNLDTTRQVSAFANMINPARVNYINAALHIEQREKRNRIPDFIDNVHTLQQHGFFVFVSSVMYPSIFDSFAKNFEYFASHGIGIIPKALQGTHNNRHYPESYTEGERAIFTEFSKRAEALYAPKYDQLVEKPTIDPFMDREKFLYGLADHRGKLCRAGEKFVRIRENGDVWRCSSQDVLGNIVQGNLTLNSGPVKCREIECPYFCEKYLININELDGLHVSISQR